MKDPKFNEQKNVWEHVPTSSVMTDRWVVLVLDNGNKILSFGEAFNAGGWVHVLDSSNYEISTWSSDEIAGDAERCVGSFLRAAAEVQFSDECEP